MTTDLIGKRLGEVEVVHELGRGGMGVLFEAGQTTLNRRVTLKVLGPGLGLTPMAADRFRREAAAALGLSPSAGDRHRAYARAWLERAMSSDTTPA